MKKTVVVSGGGAGIGRAIARSFAMSGDSVVIISRRTSVLQQTAKDLTTEAAAKGGRVEAFPGDLSESGSVAELCKSILSAHSVVDVLVNNAGGVDREPAATLKEIADSWLRLQQQRPFRSDADDFPTAKLQTTRWKDHQHEFDSCTSGRRRILHCGEGGNHRLDF